jgi:hypothetical protein
VAEWTKVTGGSGAQGQSGTKAEETMAKTKTEIARRNLPESRAKTGFCGYLRHLPSAVFRS